MQDLFAVLPSISMDGCFNHDYWKWEDTIATPALINLGYENIKWSMGDCDSFGPLSRIITCWKNGIRYQYWYG
jgi:hypothetical protein